MTFSDYKKLIDSWTSLVTSHGIMMSDGKTKITFTFWKTFLGIKRKVHQDMYAYKHNTGGKIEPNKMVPEYYVKTIYFISLLNEQMFLDEVRRHIPIFEKDKNS